MHLVQLFLSALTMCYIIIDISNHSLYTMKNKTFLRMSTSPILYRPFPISEVLLRHSQHWLAHEIWKHLRHRPTSAVHDRFKTSGIGWPMTYVSYGRSLCVLLKYGNESCKDMLAETDLIVESPVMPVNKLVNPLLT
jgi:hypothetical protein